MAKKKTPPKPEATEADAADLAEELEELSPGIIIPRRTRHKGGRPPKYRPEYARTAEIMLRRGATIGELAEAFGVTNGTIHAWKNTHQAFSDKFSELPDAFTPRIIRSLAELATGYTQDVTKVFNYKGVVIEVPMREHVPPSFAAIKHYLSVKAPEWRVNETLQVEGDDAFRELFMQMGAAKPKKDE